MMDMQFANNTGKVSSEAGPVHEVSSMMDSVKNIAKMKLRRQVMADPDLARELVAIEASPVYNSSGKLIAALSSRHLTV